MADLYAKELTLTGSIKILPRQLLEFLLIAGVVIGIVISSQSNADLGQVIGTLGLLVAAGAKMLPSLTSISQAFNNIRYARDSVNELESIFAELPKIGRTRKRTELTSTEFKTIKFDKIRYSYPNAKSDTLKGISLTIRKGDRIGVIGESGPARALC